MKEIQIKLIFLWVATMLVYLLGDVLRIFSGDFTPGEIDGVPVPSEMYFFLAAIMVIPIIMVVLTIILKNVGKWVHMVVAVGFFLFNLGGIAGYQAYDIFLLIISFGFNFLVIWYAWNWKSETKE